MVVKSDLVGFVVQSLQSKDCTERAFVDSGERKIVFASILFLVKKMNLTLINFVVLPDYVHILVEVRRAKDVTSFLKRLKTYITKMIKQNRKRMAPIWQRGTYDRVVRNDKKLVAFFDYILFNSVKHGYVDELCGWDACYGPASGGTVL